MSITAAIIADKKNNFSCLFALCPGLLFTIFNLFLSQGKRIFDQFLILNLLLVLNTSHDFFLRKVTLNVSKLK